MDCETVLLVSGNIKVLKYIRTIIPAELRLLILHNGVHSGWRSNVAFNTKGDLR
jgi:hypothetical protein